MSPLVGWALALAAVAAGYAGYGWPGVALAVSVVVFWLLLQFSRALRVMRLAAQQPVGHTASAVMLQARVQTGMSLMQVVALTRSLGRRADADAAGPGDETFSWTDSGGDTVHVALRHGRVSSVRLQRLEQHAAAGAAAGHDPGV
jgi:hypothetical protein